MTEIYPSNTMYIRSLLNNGVITNAEMAIDLAEIIIYYTYTPQDLEMQKPLTAVEQFGNWIIQGSCNKDMQLEGLGPAKVVIARNDGRIIDCIIPKVSKSALPFGKEQS